ncbi:unnamed protein product [Bursaphelenchus okinawaensis]|uniref:Glucosylceramidase n=1 Tax=Bursaphelenchus okinawaensis TaxID=465554 RepID=A0A811L259_9BILA|nr:unnamed protein product [Bursaphelenchus okinawaensis]CAG9117315.1 unnamed protein product [Bursaphelenchus okinawaensis]
MKRFYWKESFVCVCNSSYCDDVNELGVTTHGKAIIYTSDMKHDRLERTEAHFKEPVEKLVEITIDASKKRQSIIGFGGCINDNVAILTQNDDTKGKERRKKLLNQYFSKSGIEYSVGRVPIGANDASVKEWSFLNHPDDYELEHFYTLDENKIGLIKEIFAISNKIKLFGSAWSVPAWMKDTGVMKGTGRIKGTFNREYYVLYAKYLIEFIKVFKESGVDFWGLTIMNEPGNQTRTWPGTYITYAEQRDFVKERLGPMMKHTWYTKDVKIIAHDWHRDRIFDAAMTIYQDNDTMIDGLGVHWYVPGNWDKLVKTYNLRQDKFILATEATIGGLGHEYGNWQSAEMYAYDIIKNLQNYVGGWIEWSLWTDTHGGPSYVGNFVGSSIILNRTYGYYDSYEFYKQPQFYAIGHFSKFLPPDSVIVSSGFDTFDGNSNLQGIAAETPAGNLVVVILNRDKRNVYNLGINDGRENKKILKVTMKPHSIRTIIWKKHNNKIEL